ncbi:hypothetical protein CYMTET_28923 [Cymbomonas tetramitiformis]|uniref:DUF7869 domain-containing protein n=1 Tax=Cymbomonas tetramitiformis TaxID=36881 RepID=A0AAE0KVR1_9CHLO|nr:hypothetical protein CYMTET_28923 [Cymbomonas tetramitiformis]
MTKSVALNKTWWKYASVIIDGMTKWTTRLPHFRRIHKHLDKKDFLDVHNKGSMIENAGRFMDFNNANFKDDTNFLVNDMFRKVKIDFLLVGHTHENIDQMFSRSSVRLRRKQAWTLEEMMEMQRFKFFKDEEGHVVMQHKQYSSSHIWLPETPLRRLESEPAAEGPGFIKPVPFTEEGLGKLTAGSGRGREEGASRHSGLKIH